LHGISVYFAAEAGTHLPFLPTKEGWKAEFAYWLVLCGDGLRTYHPPQYLLALASINFIDPTNTANHYTTSPAL